MVVFFYAAAVGCSFFRLKKNSDSEGNFFNGFALAAFLTHTGAMLNMSLFMRRLPLANAYELMLVVAWALMFAGVLCFPFLKVKIAPTLVTMTVGLLTLLPLACPAFADNLMKVQEVNMNYALAHAMFAVASYAALGFSFVFALMYILQMRSLKLRDSGAFSRSLLPLPRLISFEKFFLGAACFLMVFSLIIGIAVAVKVTIDTAYIVKFSLGGILFILMLALLQLSRKKDFDSAVFSKLTVMLFIFAVLLIVPISIRSI